MFEPGHGRVIDFKNLCKLEQDNTENLVSNQYIYELMTHIYTKKKIIACEFLIKEKNISWGSLNKPCHRVPKRTK